MSVAKPQQPQTTNSASQLKGKPLKKKTKQEEEEDRLAQEAAEAAALAAAIPPSPFDRIEEIWALDGKEEAQRAAVGQIFEIDDGPGVCIQALTLDDAYAHLHFARSIGLNNDQTRTFYTIMSTLHDGLRDPNITTEMAFATYKTLIMQHASVVRKGTGATTSNALAPTIASTSNIVASSPIIAPTRLKSAERPSSSSGAATPREELPPSSSIISTAASQPKTFSLPLIKTITTYVSSHFFQHYSLYRAVFSSASEFRPKKYVKTEKLLVETIVPWKEELEEAVEIQKGVAAGVSAGKEVDQRSYGLQEEKEELPSSNIIESAPQPSIVPLLDPSSHVPTEDTAPLPSDDMSQLVHQHILRARKQFETLLQENERSLDVKLKQFESKLGGGTKIQTQQQQQQQQAILQNKKK